MTAIGFEPGNIVTRFDAFALGADDRIQVSSWGEGTKDYYAPDKAGIPGDHLVAGTEV